MSWRPSLGDILWLSQTVQMLKDGGILLFPTSRLMYRVDNRRQTLTLLNPQVLSEDEHSRETHARTKRLLPFLGYTMKSRGGG